MEELASELLKELNCDTAFSIKLPAGLPLIGGVQLDIAESVVITWVVMAVILILSIILTSNLKVHNVSRRQLVAETIVTKLEGIVTGMIGEEGKRYVPYLVSVLLYLGISNIIGLFGMKPPTKDLNVTAALALMSIVLVEAAGIRKKGVGGWIKSFTEPIAIVTPINILEVFIKPLSLCMRLFGNVLGAFVIMELLKLLVPVALPVPFSFSTTRPPENRAVCWLTYTNEETHRIIRENLDRSPIYAGIIEGTGPRYCPSIEDKVVKFADKERHQVFLEPEGRYTNEMYVGGMSSSLPEDVQLAMYRTVPGLENCRIVRNAYAIEYDAIDPLQLWPSLETKVLKNLFTAGQINGTSGYEEAAGQGLIAGINASKKVKGNKPLILKRDEAYIGVLIDDLVTKGTKEPYRMLTSRAEYRLLLRHDNADERLRKYGHDAGLVNDEVYSLYLDKMNRIHAEIERLDTIHFSPKSEINDLLEEKGSTRLKEGVTARSILQRPELVYEDLLPYIEHVDLTEEEMRRVTILIKYKGYIEKTLRQVEKVKNMEEKQIPADLDYDDVLNLSLEARQKLKKVRPVTIGQATRISGINPADISVLLIHLKTQYGD